MTDREPTDAAVPTLTVDPSTALAQVPMATEATPESAKAVDRKAARDLKRAGRAERRADRKDQKGNGAESGGERANGHLPGDSVGEVPAEVIVVAEDIQAVRAEPLMQALPTETVDEAVPANAAAPNGSGETAVPADARSARRSTKQAARAERKETKTVAKARPTGTLAEGESEEAAPKASLVKPQIHYVPGEDKEKQSNKTITRIESQHRNAEVAIADVDPQNAAIAPLIRYVNMVSHQLNESQKAIGKLQVERDALRSQVMSLNAEPVDVDELARQAGGTDHAATDPKTQRRLARKSSEPEKDPKSVEDMGRERRLIALVLFAVLGIAALVMRLTAHSVDLSNMSKNGLANVAIIGSFMQVFLAGMIFYRLIKIGGKGAKWLFPENDPKAHKKVTQKKDLTTKKRGA